MKKIISFVVINLILLLFGTVAFAEYPSGSPPPPTVQGYPYYVYTINNPTGNNHLFMFPSNCLAYNTTTNTLYSTQPNNHKNYELKNGNWVLNYTSGTYSTGQTVLYMNGQTFVDTNMTIYDQNGSYYKGPADSYPEFDKYWGVNHNSLLRRWMLSKEVVDGKTRWNLVFTRFDNLYIASSDRIMYADMGLWFTAENGATQWTEEERLNTGELADGMYLYKQTIVRCNHDIMDSSYNSIYFEATDTEPPLNPADEPINTVPEPVFNVPEFNWTWNPDDVFGSIGSFLTAIVTYLKDLLIATVDYLGQLLRYIFLNSSSGGINFEPLLVSATGLTQKFPFSIPWDFKNAITSLSASPTPPKWTITFDSRYFKGGGNITLDFAQFETLAAVARWGILIIFNISLILLSRKLLGS